MRSSKSRSRSKSNRNRPSGGGSGNIVNRVFDSSGPEGKVRGTPQQIIDKYNQLARDAHVGNDRVAAENFQQHAEHYMRLLTEAQREQEARRDEQERQNRERQAERDRERPERHERHERHERPERPERPERTERAEHHERVSSAPVAGNHDPSTVPQPDVIDMGSSPADGDSGLVETPEGTPKKPSRRPRTRKPAAKVPDAEPTEPSDQTSSDEGGQPEAAE